MIEKVYPIDEVGNSVNTDEFNETMYGVETLAERRTMYIMKNIIVNNISIQEMLVASYIQGVVDSQLVKELKHGDS